MGIRYTEAFIEQALFKVYSRGERTVKSVAVELKKPSVVKGFRTKEVKQWSEKNLETGSSVLSDGLSCFRGAKKAGFDHHFLVVGNSRDKKKTSAFDWVNTVPGNLKTALAGTFHKLSMHHLQRHLATFQYRFN